MLPSKTKSGSPEESTGCQSPLMGQCDPVRTINMLWDFLRFQLVWLIFFISGFLALRQQIR